MATRKHNQWVNEQRLELASKLADAAGGMALWEKIHAHIVEKNIGVYALQAMLETITQAKAHTDILRNL